MTATATAARRPNLWRHADFLKLWAAATVSGLGDEISQLAIPLIAIVTLEVSPFEIGLLGTLQFLPFILLTLPAGVWVDRLRRRPILIAADLGRGAALASIPIAYVAGALTIYQLYAVAFLVGALTVFFDVAYQSYLPALVERDDLVEGNAKLEMSRSGVSIAGPGIAGVVIGWLTAPLAVLVDAASFVGSALFVLIIRRPEPAVDRHVDEEGRRRGGMRTEVAEGLRYVLGNRYLRSIAACTGISNLFGNIGQTVILVYVVREIGLSAQVIGLIFAAGNVGVLLGAVLSSRIPRWLGVGPTIVLSAAAFSPSLLIVALAPRDAFIPFAIAATALGGFGAVVYNVNQVSLRQAITPPPMLGRMTATMRFIVWGTIPIGALAGGALGTWIGLQPAILVGAIGSFLSIPPVVFSPVWGLRRIPEAPDGAAGPGAGTADAGMANVGPAGADPLPGDDDPRRPAG